MIIWVRNHAGNSNGLWHALVSNQNMEPYCRKIAIKVQRSWFRKDSPPKWRACLSCQYALTIRGIEVDYTK